MDYNKQVSLIMELKGSVELLSQKLAATKAELSQANTALVESIFPGHQLTIKPKPLVLTADKSNAKDFYYACEGQYRAAIDKGQLKTHEQLIQVQHKQNG